MALKKKYHPLWKLLKGSLKWLAGLRIFCSIFQRHDSQQKVASSAACVWQVGNKKRDAKSAGGEARLDRWLGILSVSAEGEPEEEGDMSWGVFCFSAQCRAFWQGVMWVRGCLEPQESLSCLTSDHVWTLTGLVIRKLVIAALLASDSCFLASSSRLKSCLDPEEDNFSFYWHFIDGFWPRVGSKITPSVAFPLEITLIVIIQSIPAAQIAGSALRQRSPDCSKNMLKVLIPFTTKELEPKKKFLSQRIHQIPQLL